MPAGRIAGGVVSNPELTLASPRLPHVRWPTRRRFPVRTSEFPHTVIAMTLLRPALRGFGAFAAAVALVACGTDDLENGGTTPDPDAEGKASAPVQPAESADDPERSMGDDAELAAAAVGAALSGLDPSVALKAEQDSNELFGRPGKYDQVSFLGDSKLGCSAADSYRDFATDCGVKIERWPSPDAALARAKDIQIKLQDFGLGAEWDYVVGRLVVRASGAYTPAQAKRIQVAVDAGDPVYP